MKKAFSFTEQDQDQHRELEINGESFMLTREMTGVELLKRTGDTATAAGVHQLFSYVIDNDDWDRFVKVMSHASLPDFYRVASAVIDLYAKNPTIAATDS